MYYVIYRLSPRTMLVLRVYIINHMWYLCGLNILIIIIIRSLGRRTLYFCNDRCVTDRKIDLERDQDPCRLVIQLEYVYFLPILSINDFSLVAHL